MWPRSYMSLKIVQNQRIKEALEYYHFPAEQKTQKRGLLQTFSAFMPRFTSFSAWKPQATFPGCDGEK